MLWITYSCISFIFPVIFSIVEELRELKFRRKYYYCNTIKHPYNLPEVNFDIYLTESIQFKHIPWLENYFLNESNMIYWPIVYCMNGLTMNLRYAFRNRTILPQQSSFFKNQNCFEKDGDKLTFTKQTKLSSLTKTKWLLQTRDTET